ncbi:hypothetical protein E2P81_ATG00294 [Venturia nashicola]|uniref:Myb-like domain-containing protein n=1 Tax=Venturia nashicola TaxID=86259 RepID=A0A4Z1PTD1_9PEZI|nr:hypothetical protein E6O75_ATG00305 [Venturia nashicola]TLD39307.1 hypothetical protein E2P81_ATG00294 [Venturia nashicola]
MRLPGTFNLGGRNQLPTAEFLIHYESLKRAKERAKLEPQANGGDKAEFGDKPFPKRITSTSKKDNNNAKKVEKPGDVVPTPEGESFTKAQDETIIRMKMEGKTWAMIGTEIGKEKGAVAHRFKEIKPSDFDVKEKEWKEKNGGGGGQNQGKQKNKGQNDQNENKDSQNQGGKGNNHNNQQNNQQHEGKNKNKGKNNQQDNQNNKQNSKKKEEAQAEAGADDDGGSEAGTWAVADENFTEKEVTVLEKIVEIELRNAFVRIAKSFAVHPDGKRVHPDSIVMKVLGEALDLSCLGGAS